VKHTANILVLFLMVLFILQGCKYQKEELSPVASRTNAPIEKVDTVLSLDDAEDSVEDQSGSVDSVDTTNTDDQTTTPAVEEKSLEDLLDIFFGTFVLPINKVGEAFDTRVDYERLHDLLVKKEPIYKDLVTQIERKFRDRNALQGKSHAYKKSFYINAYNYFAIRLINRFYIKDGKKIKSILDLSTGLRPHQIFDARFIRVHSESLVSLNTVEKTYLSDLTERADGRTHFAVICVSKGCPITLNKAYREELLEDQLDFITNASLKLPRMLVNDQGKKKSYLTKIFDWYSEEFEADKGTVKGFIEHHGGEVLFKTKNLSYDWTLNSLNENGQVIVKPNLPKPIAPTTGGEGLEDGVTDNSNTDNTGGNDSADTAGPCDDMIFSENERIMSVCSNLISGKEHKLTKNTVTEAKLCLIRNFKEDTYAIRGTLSSIDKKEVASLIEVDFSSKAKVDDEGYFTWGHKDSIRQEAKFHPEELTLKFRQNTKGVRRSIRKIVVGCE
jgi:hypothetical protein